MDKPAQGSVRERVGKRKDDQHRRSSKEHSSSRQRSRSREKRRRSRSPDKWTSDKRRRRRSRSKSKEPARSKSRRSDKKASDSPSKSRNSNKDNSINPAKSKSAEFPKDKLFASVIGYIGENTGILRITSKGKYEKLHGFFSKENLFVMSRNVIINSVGVEKCVSPCALETILPLGSGVACNVREVTNSLFSLQATVVWPAMAGTPNYTPSIPLLNISRNVFVSSFKVEDHLSLAFDGNYPNNLEIWSIKVCEIISNDR